MGRKPKEPIDERIQKEPTPVEEGPFRKMATKVQAAPFRDRDTQVTNRPKQSPPDADGDPAEPAIHRPESTKAPSSRWLVAALVLALAVILCQSIALVVLLSDRRPAAGAPPEKTTQPTPEPRIKKKTQVPDLDTPEPELPMPEVDLGEAGEPGTQPIPAPRTHRLAGTRKQRTASKGAGVRSKGDKKLAPDAAATLDLLVEPGGDVSIDGDNYGWCTRMQFPLTAGRHHLQVSNDALEISRGYHLRLATKERRRLVVRLGQVASEQACKKSPGRFGALSVGVASGWAFVYIDGEKIKTTPLLNHRIATGHHRVVLRDGEGRAMRLWDICVMDGEETRLVDRR